MSPLKTGLNLVLIYLNLYILKHICSPFRMSIPANTMRIYKISPETLKKKRLEKLYLDRISNVCRFFSPIIPILIKFMKSSFELKVL